MKFNRMKSTDILTHIGNGTLTEQQKEQAWAVLSNRAHTDNITGAISNNGPKERNK
jgi:hypothetical protein